MAIYREDIVDIELESGNIHRSFLNHSIGSGDAMANWFGVRLFRNGEPVSAEDCTVTGIFMAPDGTNYAINETSWSGSTYKSGNKAEVCLPEICYAARGQFCLAIKLTGGSVTGTMRIIDGTVDETGADSAVVPTSTIPSTEDIIAAYEDAVAVIASSVRFDATQTLTDTQKSRARNNIGAASEADFRHNVILEQGAYGSSSGSVSSDYRIRLETPIYVKKGTELLFNDGSLYHMIWELSTASTAGGNVITSKSWNNDRQYTVQNDCYVMFSFSKTQSGATEQITVNDFLNTYYVDIVRASECAVIYTAEQALAEIQKTLARNNIDTSDNERYFEKMFFRNLLDPEKLIAGGCYSHSDPSVIIATETTKYLPPVRIYNGVPYTFKNIYAYFSTIIYDDGTVYDFSSEATPATQTINLTPAKDGTVYVTVNTGYDNSAMIVAGISEYTGAYFTGYLGGVTNFPTTIGPGNYSKFLPDWKNARPNSLYNIVSTTSMLYDNGGLWTDVPLPLHNGQRIIVLMTIGDLSRTGSSQICYITSSGEVYTRYINEIGGTQYFTSWANASGDNTTIIIDKNGSGDFTSFSEGIKYATTIKNSHVYVLPGTYDIIQEYKDLYGNDFFDNFSTTSDQGPILSNGITVEFSPNARLVCNYTGSNAYVQNRFAPLNSGSSSSIGGRGFTLINCHLEDHNVRYSMHDERNYNTEYYHNRYIGCHFIHDRGTGTGYIQAIGGGLGKNGLIEIDNCIFESVTSTGAIVSWHNCKLDGSRSQIFIRNCIIKGNVRFSWYGEEDELVSTMMVTGCKMYSDPITTQENQDYDNRNVEILAWGNEIGTPN